MVRALDISDSGDVVSQGEGEPLRVVTHVFALAKGGLHFAQTIPPPLYEEYCYLSEFALSGINFHQKFLPSTLNSTLQVLSNGKLIVLPLRQYVGFSSNCRIISAMYSPNQVIISTHFADGST